MCAMNSGRLREQLGQQGVAAWFMVDRSSISWMGLH
jgi:hypothetical protein